MQQLWRNNGLTIVLLILFAGALIGQTITGWQVYNVQQEEHSQPVIGLGQYLRTGHFVEAVFENWESEFLQMALYVVLTVFLFQRGSAESKNPDQQETVDAVPDEDKPPANTPWPVRHGGWILKLYENSLAIVLLLLFLLSFSLHALGGARAYNEEQQVINQPTVSTIGYLATSQFWFESFQNWQSEFLSIAAVVVLSIFLRQRGSPESKPVDAPHRQTGSD